MKISAKSFSSIWFWALLALIILAVFWYLLEIRPTLINFTIDGPPDESNLVTADTYTYWFHASETPWFLLPINLMGPVSLIKLLDENFDLAVLFNVVLLVFVLRELCRYTEVKILPFVVFLLGNPLVMGQLYAVNKEILIMISLLFMVVYIHSGQTRHMIMAIAIAIFSKPEFLALIMVFLGLRSLRLKRRVLYLVALIVLISILYSAMPNMDSYTKILAAGQTTESLGITVLLQDLAGQHYLYFGVIVPRLLLTIYSGGVFYASFFMLALIVAVLGKKFQLTDDVVLLLYLFLIMVSIVPFPHYRYILPTYPLLLFLVLRRKKAIYISSHTSHQNI